MNPSEFYESDDRFKEYVDRYSKTYHLTLEEALSHKLVLDTMQYYAQTSKPEKS